MLLMPIAISVQRATAATCPAVLYDILPTQTAAGTTVIWMCYHSVRFNKVAKPVKTEQRSDVNLLVAI